MKMIITVEIDGVHDFFRDGGLRSAVCLAKAFGEVERHMKDDGLNPGMGVHLKITDFKTVQE